MSTTQDQIKRELLELRKMSEEIESELARRHDWATQERFWASQERHWYWQRWAWIGTVVLGIVSLITTLLIKTSS